MFKKRMFGQAFIDEVALFDSIADFNLTVPHERPLQQLLLEEGIEKTTAIVYKHVYQKHRSFIEKVNSYPTTPAPALTIKLVVIPGMFYKEYPEMGCDGMLIKNIAEKFNFVCDILDIDSRGSILKNKETIVRKLTDDPHENIWIVSFSKGSIETRIGLEEIYKSGLTRNNIKGWINVSGPIKGTALSDEKLNSALKYFLWRVFAEMTGIFGRMPDETAKSNALLKAPVNVPPQLEQIHLVGFPLASHLQPFTIGRYRKLSTYGPNDGIIMLSEALNLDGHVYPIWGVDHFLRSNHISEIIYKLLNYITNKN
ncbi:MAG: hypothetical protein Q7R73_05155 [bacterium]|nr:hypothetical protein [bacterium]